VPPKPDPFGAIPPDVLTTDELAARLGFNAVTIRGWVKEGIVPAKQLGKEWRYWWPAVVISLFYDGEDDDDQAEGCPPAANKQPVWPPEEN